MFFPYCQLKLAELLHAYHISSHRKWVYVPPRPSFLEPFSSVPDPVKQLLLIAVVSEGIVLLSDPFVSLPFR